MNVNFVIVLFVCMCWQVRHYSPSTQLLVKSFSDAHSLRLLTIQSVPGESDPIVVGVTEVRTHTEQF